MHPFTKRSDRADPAGRVAARGCLRSSSGAGLLALMPSGSASGLFGPRGDVFYAIFVAVVLVVAMVAMVIFYRRAPPEDRRR